MKLKNVLLIILVSAAIGNDAMATAYYALSLNRAKALTESVGAPISSTHYTLGGINHIMGFVYDRESQDIILVGQIGEEEQKITLDDLAVGLRAVLVKKTCPTVSIDKSPETQNTKKQRVVFGGGIENTQFGQDLLSADILLKNLALGFENASVWGLDSYFDMSLNEYRLQKKLDNANVKFWFVPADNQVKLVARDDVFAIRNIAINVQTQLLTSNEKKINQDSKNAQLHDALSDRFSTNLSESFEDLCTYYPALSRLRALFDLVAIASGCNMLNTEGCLTYWIDKYKIKEVPTPSEYPLVIRSETIQDGGSAILQLNGGIQLKALISRLKSGDVSAMKRAVLGSKPGDESLIWRIPLDIWSLAENPSDQELIKSTFYQEMAQKFGTNIGRSISKSLAGFSSAPMSAVSEGIRQSLPSFRTVDNLARYSRDIGGVLLSNTASVSGAEDNSQWDTNFSFILAEDDALIDSDMLKKFLTSLWAVYFAKTPPGISIDPIAPGVDKHLVRYIGDVINSDLGRVMREADYTMKKWAVGTERPAIAGFKNVDDISATTGLNYVGASRRFWFVPEAMSFTRSNNMLLFKGGNMTLKTEFIMQNKATRADPADEEFATFFTNHYDEIAKKYPAYQELFDYAKLVSLAQYLKENKVPLLWYLLANKDLVMTEDSPGVVDELAKGSRYFDNIEIRGGVEMDPAKGRYVYDQSAVAAINQAIAAMPASVATTSLAAKQTRTAPIEPFSFNHAEKSYTVVPQHSLTSGKDRRGIRYQTDVAFRNGDLPGLEMVRYFNPAQRTIGEFGDGWHLLIPYQIMPADSEKVEFRNVLVPKRMAFSNLLSGEKEILEFSKDRYSIVGWVPDSLQNSQVVGLFLMSDVSYRMADKIGNEFWFDQAGRLTDMRFSGELHYKIEYGIQRINSREMEEATFNITASGYQEFLNAFVPNQLSFKLGSSDAGETFTFSQDRYNIAGYIPDDEEKSRYKMAALMSDGSLRLVEKNGQEHNFDDTFVYEESQAEGIASYSLGDLQIRFEHEIRKGHALIVKASLFRQDSETPFLVLDYHYDRNGRLCQIERKDEKKG